MTLIDVEFILALEATNCHFMGEYNPVSPAQEREKKYKTTLRKTFRKVRETSRS